MSRARVRADTDALRTFADRSGALTMVARSRTAYLQQALWSLNNSSSEFVGHVPDIDDEVRALLAVIEGADNEVRSVAVRFEATQQRLAPAVQRHFGPGGSGFHSTIGSAAGSGHPFAAIPPWARTSRRAFLAGLRPGAQIGVGRHVSDPATLVVATGVEEIDVSVGTTLGLVGSGGFEWTEFADGHFEVTETTQGGASAEGAVGADVTAWKAGVGGGASVGASMAMVEEHTFVVADEDELHLLMKHRVLRRAEDAHESAHGLLVSSPGVDWVGGLVGGAFTTVVPDRVRTAVGSAVESVVDSVVPDLDEIVGYEPTRVGGATGVQFEVSAAGSGGATLVEDLAGVSADATASLTYTELHTEDGTQTRQVVLGGVGDGSLGVLGVELGGTPVGIEGALGRSVKVVATADADGVPVAVEIEVEVQTGDDLTVETISYDLSDPRQRAEAAPISALAGGDVGAAPASLGLILGVVRGRPTVGQVGAVPYRVARETGSVGGQLSAGAKIEVRATHKRERRDRTD